MLDQAWRFIGLSLVVLAGCVHSPPPMAAGAPLAAPPPMLAAVPPASSGQPVAAAEVVPSGPFVAYTDPGELPELAVAGKPEQKLPLEHTAVKARLTGFVAEVEVTQTYTNPYREPIEAVYVFPLPENSAVNQMRMVIGPRIIEAEIQRRAEARRTYERAKREGHTAALLEQERPNVFTQSVANIEPDRPIKVVVRYVQDLTYDSGQYEFVFPMVVGPRFMPGAPSAGPHSGSGTHPDTDRVRDASRISPPIVGQGERSGHDISIEVLADPTLPVGQLEVPTHEVKLDRSSDGALRVSLSPRDSLPNRDFLLRYRVATKEPRAALFVSPDGRGGGYFSLVVQPPELDVDQAVGRRELIFVVDVSGSMSGVPLGLCRRAMREAIHRMRPVDTFDIITFSGASRRAFGRPRPANAENVRAALAIIDGLSAGGGTQMLNAVDEALSPEVGRGRNRYVFFLTDGYVGDEAEIIGASGRFVQTLSSRGQRARVFGYGVGSSVNRHLIDGLSRAGRGIAVYASTREDPERGVNHFYHYIDRPTLEKLALTFGGTQPSEIYPRVLPDLFASHPLIMHGRYTGTLGSVTVSGNAGGRRLALRADPHPTDLGGSGSTVLGDLWARAKVTDLMEQLYEGSNPRAPAEVTELGLSHRLVTQFTSFVAVDRSRVVSAGRPKTVVQPVEGPEGVDVEMAGGKRVHAGDTSGRSPSAASTLPPRESADEGYGYSLDDGEAASSPLASPAGNQERKESPQAERMSSAQAEPAYAVAPKRGCGCRMVGGPGSSGSRLALGLWLALFGVAWARSRRDRPF